jgi:hypothetical protein
VGRIWQEFGTPLEGTVNNVIEASLALPLLDTTTALLTVRARYAVRSARSIALRFEAAELGGVEMGADLERALAPAVLPRGWWNLAALEAVSQVREAASLAGRWGLLLLLWVGRSCHVPSFAAACAWLAGWSGVG